MSDSDEDSKNDWAGKEGSDKDGKDGNWSKDRDGDINSQDPDELDDMPGPVDRDEDDKGQGRGRDWNSDDSDRSEWSDSDSDEPWTYEVNFSDIRDDTTQGNEGWPTEFNLLFDETDEGSMILGMEWLVDVPESFDWENKFFYHYATFNETPSSTMACIV